MTILSPRYPKIHALCLRYPRFPQTHTYLFSILSTLYCFCFFCSSSRYKVKWSKYNFWVFASLCVLNISFQRWFVGSSMRSSSQVLLLWNNWKHTEMAWHICIMWRISIRLFSTKAKQLPRICFIFSYCSKLANFLPHSQEVLNLRLIRHESKSIPKILVFSNGRLDCYMKFFWDRQRV